MAEPEVSPVPGPDRLTAQEFIGTDRLIHGQPAAWLLRTRNPYLTRYSGGVRVGRLPELSARGMVRSEAGQRAALHAAQALLDAVRSFPDSDYRAAEPEHIEKACLQSGYIPGWQFIEGGLSRPDHALTGSLDEEILLLERYLDQFGGVPARLEGISYPRGKFKGYPFYSRSDAALPVAAAMAPLIRTREDAEEVGHYVARLLGDPTLENIPLSAVQFTRTGPIAKAQPYFEMDTEKAVLAYSAKGTYARRRHVNAQPSFTNMACRANAVAAKLWIRGAPAFHHTGRLVTAAQVARARGRGLTILSDDISGYDKSVSRHHQLALYRLWARRLPDKDVMPLYEWSALDMPSLSPSWSASDGGIMVYGKDSGVSSGHIGTSIDGTALNWCRVLRCVAAGMGVSSADAFAKLGRDWEVWIWGDDTLIAVPPSFNQEKYQEASSALGYKCKLSTAPVFLMTIYPKAGAPTNLATRVFAQTVWREHEQFAEVLTIFGLWVRFSLLRGHPLESLTWTLVRDAAAPDGMLARRRLVTRGDLEVHVRTRGFEAELAEALRRDPSSAATLIDSLTRGSGDQSDNPDVAFAFSLLGRAQLRSTRWYPPGRLGLGLTGTEGRALLDKTVSGYLKFLDSEVLKQELSFREPQDDVETEGDVEQDADE